MKQNITLGVPIDTLKFALEVFSNIPHFGSTEEKELKKYGEELTTKGFTEMIQLDKTIEGYAKLLSEILLKVTPIGFGVDKEIRTNKNVFAIQGFNVGNYGNGEVAIIFKQSIMRHPDFFMTPVAAMGYYQGWYCYNSK